MIGRWSGCRYGPFGMKDYKVNVRKLFQTLRRVLQRKTLVIWTTALPVATHVRGGVILEQIRWQSETLRYDVALANDFCSRVAADHGFDVLDLHYAMRRHIGWRLPDGIHWNELAHRTISGLLLQHVCRAWHVILPVRCLGRSGDCCALMNRTAGASYTGYQYQQASWSSSNNERSTEQRRSPTGSPSSSSSRSSSSSHHFSLLSSEESDLGGHDDDDSEDDGGGDGDVIDLTVSNANIPTDVTCSNQIKRKSAQRRRKHCALAVVRRTHKQTNKQTHKQIAAITIRCAA